MKRNKFTLQKRVESFGFAFNGLITSLTIGLIVLSQLGSPQSLIKKSYIVAGDSISNDILIKSLNKINSEFEKEWWINLDADDNDTIDIEVHYKISGGNNRDSYLTLKPLNSKIQLNHSIAFEDSIHKILPITYTNPYGFTGEYKPSGYTGNEKWVFAFALKDTITDFSEWTNDLCYTYVYFARDQAMKEWSFSSITNKDFIGFRKLRNNDTIYGWIDAQFRHFAIKNNLKTQIPKVEITRELELFPNPTSQKIFLKNHEKNFLNCKIINLFGSVLQNKKSESELIDFDISNLSNGVYMVIINKNNSQMTIKKFIKN